MPVIPIEYALTGCLAWCSGYAAFLTWTKPGRALALDWTEFSVVLGVGFVLVWYALVDLQAALMAFLFFAAGGLPMVVRSILLRQQNDKSAIAYLHDELRRNANDGAE